MSRSDTPMRCPHCKGTKDSPMPLSNAGARCFDKFHSQPTSADAPYSNLPTELVERALRAAPTLEADLRAGKLHSFEEVFADEPRSLAGMPTEELKAIRDWQEQREQWVIAKARLSEHKLVCPFCKVDASDCFRRQQLEREASQGSGG